MARLDDIAIAKTLCDYFVGRRVYGQGLDTNTQAGLALYQRGGRLSTALTLQNAAAQRTVNQQAFWEHIGARQRREPDGSGLWCAQEVGTLCTGLHRRFSAGRHLRLLHRLGARRVCGQTPTQYL